MCVPITVLLAARTALTIQLVKVWFQLRDERPLCLPRITEPEKHQALLLAQRGWELLEQPPPRIYPASVP